MDVQVRVDNYFKYFYKFKIIKFLFHFLVRGLFDANWAFKVFGLKIYASTKKEISWLKFGMRGALDALGN